MMQALLFTPPEGETVILIVRGQQGVDGLRRCGPVWARWHPPSAMVRPAPGLWIVEGEIAGPPPSSPPPPPPSRSPHGPVPSEPLPAGFRSPPLPPKADPIDAAFAALGLSPEATQEDVQAAWKQLSRSLHPDRLPPTASDEERRASTARFQAISAAWQVLRTWFDMGEEEDEVLIEAATRMTLVLPSPPLLSGLSLRPLSKREIEDLHLHGTPWTPALSHLATR